VVITVDEVHHGLTLPAGSKLIHRKGFLKGCCSSDGFCLSEIELARDTALCGLQVPRVASSTKTRSSKSEAGSRRFNRQPLSRRLTTSQATGQCQRRSRWMSILVHFVSRSRNTPPCQAASGRSRPLWPGQLGPARPAVGRRGYLDRKESADSVRTFKGTHAQPSNCADTVCTIFPCPAPTDLVRAFPLPWSHYASVARETVCRWRHPDADFITAHPRRIAGVDPACVHAIAAARARRKQPARRALAACDQSKRRSLLRAPARWR